MKQPVITLFAGSSAGNDPALIDTAKKIGHIVAEHGYALVYGAGTTGVMGAAAGAALAAGGKVSACMPKIYQDSAQFPGVDLTVVENEYIRFQQLMAAKPAFCIVLPGGPGALREAMQALEAAVYEDGCPIVLVKVGNYMDGIKNYFDQAVMAGLIRADKKDKMLLLTVDEIEILLQSKKTAPQKSPQSKLS